MHEKTEIHEKVTFIKFMNNMRCYENKRSAEIIKFDVKT